MIGRMAREYATLRRRPFLTPVWLTVLAAACVLSATFWLVHVASTTMVVVVSATGAPAGARAEQLAPLLGSRSVGGSGGHPSALYAATDPAAVALAQALAPRMLLPVETRDGDPDAVAGRVLGEQRGARVVLVVPAADVPAVIAALVGSRGKEAVAAGAMAVIAVPRFGRPALLFLGTP